MAKLINTATANQSQPAPQAMTTGFFGNNVYVNASATGSGTWSATYNVAPVSAGGVVGSVRQFTVTNTTPMIDIDVQTGASQFIGWWTGFSGTITLAIGSVDG